MKGPDTLTVTGITGVRLPFTTTMTFQFKVPPGGEYFAKTVCFKPTTETADSINVTLESDSQGADCSPTSYGGDAAKRRDHSLPISHGISIVSKQYARMVWSMFSMMGKMM